MFTFDFLLKAVQFSLVAQLCLTLCDPWTAACQAFMSITNSWILLKLMSTESVMSPNHLILGHHLFLLPSIFPNIRVFSNESTLRMRWPNYWSFSFNISPSIEHSELISFRMDQLALLAVQETLKSLLQHHSSKASILQFSTFFILYLISGKRSKDIYYRSVQKMVFTVIHSTSEFLLIDIY